MSRAVLALLVIAAALGCRSADWRGAGPAYPPAIGHPSNRHTAMPPARNHPSSYGWGSAYDPHPSGSLAQPGTPQETGALPPWWFPYGFPIGRPMGVPPPVADPGR